MENRKFSLSSYPLCWPGGWARSRSQKVGRFQRNKQSPSIIEGLNRILRELAAMKISREDVLVSTNIPTRLDGLPRSDQREPTDSGAAVYWRDSQNAPMKCMAIDIYNRVADNLCAIAASLEAMRAIERHGGAQVQERTFRGFAALPASTGNRPWREVLKLDSVGIVLSREMIQTQYRQLARLANQLNAGHDAEQLLRELNVARDEALKEIQ